MQRRLYSALLLGSLLVSPGLAGELTCTEIKALPTPRLIDYYIDMSVRDREMWLKRGFGGSACAHNEIFRRSQITKEITPEQSLQWERRWRCAVMPEMVDENCDMLLEALQERQRYYESLDRAAKQKQ